MPAWLIRAYAVCARWHSADAGHAAQAEDHAFKWPTSSLAGDKLDDGLRRFRHGEYPRR